VWSGTASRRVLTATSAVAALCLAAPLRAAEMSWNAPADCQRADAVSGQVERQIGRPLSEVDAPSFQVAITHKGDRWQLELVTLAPAPSSRTLEGPSCVAVTDAAGVAMALAISASAESARGAPPESTAPGVAPAPAPLTAAPPAAPTPTPPERAEPAAPSAGARLGAVVGLSAAVDSATLPAPVLGLGVGAGLRLAPLRVEAQGLAFAPSTLRLVDRQSAEFTLFAGALLGCFEAPLPSVVVLGCAGAELGRIAGEGRGVTDPQLGSALWQAARVEGGVELPPADGLRFTARFGVGVPFNRPDFQLDGNTVHRPAAMTLRVTVGLMLLP
jgi:hypothetical protein